MKNLSIRWLGLGLLSASRAQSACSNSGLFSGNYAAYSQAHLEELSKCNTILGDIFIDSNISETITLTGIKKITGNLEINSHHEVSALRALEMPNLRAIGGSLILRQSDGLESVTLNELEHLGSLSILGVKGLSSLHLPKLSRFGVAEESFAPSLITPTTMASPLTSLNLTFLDIYGTSLKSLNISTISYNTVVTIKNNPSLTELTLGFQIIGSGNTSPDLADQIMLDVEGNNASLSLHLPYLENVYQHVLLSQISYVQIPLLTFLNNTFRIASSGLEVFSAPSLATAISDDDSLSFMDNTNLTNISLPILQTISGLDIYNTAAIGYEYGVHMPSLENGSNFELYNEGGTNCRLWNNLRCRGIIQGSYVCADAYFGPADDPGTCNDDYPLSGLTLSQKLRVALPVSFVVPTVAVLIWLGIRWWRKEAAKPKMVSVRPEGTDIELPKYDDDTAPPIYHHDPDSGTEPSDQNAGLQPTTQLSIPTEPLSA